MSLITNGSISYRVPAPQDGADVWRLVKEAGTLDLNSPYCYIMLCDKFRGTCAIARSDESVIGFVSGYRLPDKPDTLFVWQVAVKREARGKGVAKSLLREVLQRQGNETIRFVEATVGPDNAASGRLFKSLAEERGCRCTVTEHYGSELFPGSTGHDRELMHRVGPLR
ncbi:diaminobutyrate acetyltransferase [Paenibacillus arenilitoris]|uniref:L-2,4-diaminobutyric acid acetyltransferase n=1 Tax=Paenibacillus arenilitoris TaxID=2772299 RepID=A0A927CM42_9BACL|nr:diaminobutyrate acetyltransferase [Paenibacillus arenilitoris]MBD2869742.1 diaminobutyrate acetyltransferase [Paenibacillus arenilitoris]